jgi:hypothetical protein
MIRARSEYSPRFATMLLLATCVAEPKPYQPDFMDSKLVLIDCAAACVLPDFALAGCALGDAWLAGFAPEVALAKPATNRTAAVASPLRVRFELRRSSADVREFRRLRRLLIVLASDNRNGLQYLD